MQGVAQSGADAKLSRRTLVRNFASISALVALSGAANASEQRIEMRELEYGYCTMRVPAMYVEVKVPLRNAASSAMSSTIILLKDGRAGLAGNTISLSRQPIPDGGIRSVAELGSPVEVAERLLGAEHARGSGALNGGGDLKKYVRSVEQRLSQDELVYYTAEYAKRVLGVPRVVLTTLVAADGQLYALTAEEDAGRFEREMGAALRETAESFEVFSKAIRAMRDIPIV